MTNYAWHTFTTTFLNPVNPAEALRPLPPAAALAELDDTLAGLPAAVERAEQAARAAIQDYEATLPGSQAMNELAGQIHHAALQHRALAPLETDLAALRAAEPGALARAVGACAEANTARADAHTRVDRALAEQVDALRAALTVLEPQIHQAALDARARADSREGFDARQQMVELEQRFCRLRALVDYQGGGRYRQAQHAAAADPEWEPDVATPVKSTAGVWRSLIGARR